MIDIEKVKKNYEKYINQYNLNDAKIVLEIEHMYKTSENAKWLAKCMKISKEDIELAQFIGLLHNIGKLEQIKEYQTLIDKDSINHAEYGVKILFENGTIREFVDSEEDNMIIKSAILNHNKAKLDNINNDKELLHCKILRDADKLDIFNMVLTNKLETTYPLDNYNKERISDVVKKEFKENHLVSYKNIKTCADLVAMQIALVFDMNFLYSIEKVNNENYIEKLIKKFDSQDKETIQDLNELKDIAEKYIQEKIKEGEICLKNY